MAPTRTETVMRMLHDGWAPSQIDRALQLPDGTARHLVTAEWAREKDEHSQRMRKTYP